MVVGCLFAVDALGWDVAAFGISAIAAALAVAIYEAWFVLSGRLQVPMELDAAPPRAPVPGQGTAQGAAQGPVPEPVGTESPC